MKDNETKEETIYFDIEIDTPENVFWHVFGTMCIVSGILLHFVGYMIN
jgi:hypothetical protein